MRALLIILLCLAPMAYASEAPVPSAAKTESSPELDLNKIREFSICKTDDDCTVIKDECGYWISVNKASSSKADDYISPFRNDNCNHSPIKKPELFGCRQGLCQIRPDAHKCLMYSETSQQCYIRCDKLSGFLFFQNKFCNKACIANQPCER